MSETASNTASAGGWRVGSHVRVRGQRWRIDGIEAGDGCTALRLQPIADASRPLTLLAPFDRPLLLDNRLRIAIVSGRRCLREIDRVLADTPCVGGLRQIARASIHLLPYQLEPALAMLRHGAARVVVADGVGLGKTIEAGIAIAELTASIESSRVLVLAPAGLRDQWRQELASHFALSSWLADAEWLRRTGAERPADVNPWSLPGIYVASHDLIKRPETLRALEDVFWDLVVVDEAHAATTGTDRRAAIHRVACGAQRVMLLTATPPAGDRRELAALCAIGRAEAGEPAPVMFARCSHDVRPGRPRRTRILTVAPTPLEIAMHRALERYADRVRREASARRDERARLASIVLRKRALSSAGSLLASLLRRIDLLRDADASGPRQLALPLDDEDPLEDDEPIETLAAPGLDDRAREVRWLCAIAETARAAAREESKIRWLLRLLRRVHEPAIVFTEYRDTLSWLERRIAATGRSLVVLHGGMDPAARSSVPALLRAGAQTLLATDAAAEGLNLHHRCRIVIHFELPWNPARLEQRAGRVDRIGQAAPVHEMALVSDTAAERLVLAPLVRRAVHVRRTGFGSHALAALTESRIADAIISGTPLEPIGSADTGSSCADAARGDLRHEAEVEAVRIETLRRLLQRSPHRTTRSRSANQPTAWVTTARSRIFDRRVTLVFAVDVENSVGARVHGEHVVIRVVRRGRSCRLHRELRDLAAALALSPRVQNALDEQARAILDRLRPLVDSAYLERQRRRLVISRAGTSAAQRLVQLPLPGTGGTGRRPPLEEPRPIEDAELVTRPSLVAVLVREPGAA